MFDSLFNKCDHDFVEMSREKYLDYSCYNVLKIVYQCKKCKKKKVVKYW